MLYTILMQTSTKLDGIERRNGSDCGKGKTMCPETHFCVKFCLKKAFVSINL